MKASRHPENPIIQPKDVRPSRPDFEVIGVFNAAAARLSDEVVLLLRVAERPLNNNPDVVLTSIYDPGTRDLLVERFDRANADNDFSDPRLIVTPRGTFLTSISHLRLARSRDGVHFDIPDGPALSAAADYEAFGLEDPRISLIDGLFYITYVAVSPAGAATALAVTTDFRNFERKGIIFCPDNKDVVILPETINGRHYALHRPTSNLSPTQNIWIADSPDLLCWANHRLLLGARPQQWDELKIGSGAPPFRTERGWLEIYHGADRANRYCLGAVLLDPDEPSKVLARTAAPVFEPQAPYETGGFFGNVVFTCGLLCEDRTIRLYYGAADTSICYAELPLDDVLAALEC